MAKFKIVFDGEEQDEVYDSEEEAEEQALYMCSCAQLGAETLHMSNPGDYEYDEATWKNPKFKIIEVEEPERFPDIDWYCDRCNAHLNVQPGFDDHHYVWVCTECGYKNSISASNILEDTVIYTKAKNKR